MEDAIYALVDVLTQMRGDLQEIKVLLLSWGTPGNELAVRVYDGEHP